MAQKAVNKDRNRLLVRRLGGELSAEEADLLQRLEEADPDFAESAKGLQAAWDQLESPPEVTAPDLATEILERLRHGGDEGALFGARSSAGTRLAAAAMLIFGVFLGMRLDDRFVRLPEPTTGALLTSSAAGSGSSSTSETEDLLAPMAPSWSDAYWQALEETAGELSQIEESAAGDEAYLPSAADSDSENVSTQGREPTP